MSKKRPTIAAMVGQALASYSSHMEYLVVVGFETLSQSISKSLLQFLRGDDHVGPVSEVRNKVIVT
jgi:hypothetical protein